MPGLNPIGDALCSGNGFSLTDQMTAQESPEQRRRRLQALASQQARLGVGQGYGAALGNTTGNPIGTSLFG